MQMKIVKGNAVIIKIFSLLLIIVQIKPNGKFCKFFSLLVRDFLQFTHTCCVYIVATNVTIYG